MTYCLLDQWILKQLKDGKFPMPSAEERAAFQEVLIELEQEQAVESTATPEELHSSTVASNSDG